ncbi:MAG: amidohydrolase family protein, partial [Chloroflexi bacterium]|nr:amidohydrolase family protein [Chloroflexota bacterium]
CPGFIDIQSHSITPLMIDGRSLSKITQGVTTEIMGELWTPAPYGGKITTPLLTLFGHPDPEWGERVKTWKRFRDWLEAMVDYGVSPNIGSFLGGSSLRQYVKGMDMSPPTAAELTAMEKLTAQAMEEGAFGIARALIYPPDAYTTFAELVATSKIVSQYNGLYITHMRSESDDIFTALEEAFEVGRQANLPVEIYHLKAAGKRNWDKMPAVIEKINQARAKGLDVTAGMYPYTGSGTTLSAVLPPWAARNGKLLENLRDPEIRKQIKEELLQPTGGWEAMVNMCDPEGVLLLDFRSPEHKQYAGKSLAEIAKARNQDWADTVMDLLLSEEPYIGQDSSTSLIFSIYFLMQEENIRQQLQLPWIKISTDAGGYDPAWAKDGPPVHPRSYGTFPRILGKYVREENILTLEDAIRKMTSSVASRLGIQNRGLLREDMVADVIIFDPQTIGDHATFKAPHQLSEGVQDVWVNGTRVLKNGQHTGATPGEIVSRS